MAYQTELILTFNPADRGSVLTHPLIARAPVQEGPADWVDAYFDTPDQTLLDAGISTCVRNIGKLSLQTVSHRRMTEGGLWARTEWERPFAEGFNFSTVDAVGVREALETRQDKLVPVVVAEYRRDTRLIEPLPGIRILLAIDSGRICAGEREKPMHELELTLFDGSPIDLLNFAIALALDLPLLPLNENKAQRGYQLFCNEPSKPAKAGKSPLQAEWTAMQAFRVLASQTHRDWLTNLLGAQASYAPEFIHQLRISLRRLRTLLQIFQAILSTELVAVWRQTLGNLASSTGDARDLDVLRETILQPVVDSEDGPALEALLQRALEAGKQASEAAHGSLSPMLHGVPLLTFMKTLETLAEPPMSENLQDFARHQLKQMRSRARKRLRTAREEPTPESAHRLRIALKKLRYSCEFLAPLFDEGSLLRHAKRISAIQDDLGFLNDLHVSWLRLGNWAHDDPELLEACSQIAAWHDRRAKELLATVFDTATELIESTPPWKAQSSTSNRQ